MPKVVDHEKVFAYAVNQAYWFGEVRRKEIERELDLSHDLASELIGRLRFEGVLEPSGKAFVLVPGAEALAFVKERLSINACFSGMPEATTLPGEPSAWSLDGAKQAGRAEVLRALVQAVRSFQSIEIVHVAMSANANAVKRTVEPLEFVCRAGVWCVLAHCHLAQAQMLFELPQILRTGRRQRARMREIPKTLRGKHVCTPKSPDQLVLEEANFEAHPLLTEDQKSVVEFQFGMRHQRLKLKLEPHRMAQFRSAHVAAGPLDRPEGKLLIERK